LDAATAGAELFELRVRAHRPGFSPGPSDRALVEEIVKQLDGLPLAIELAAARLRILSLDQLRDRLRDRFKVLGGGGRGRHATLETTLDWSWELLEPWEQSALAQASVFEGGFTLEAAEAVMDLRECPGGRFALDGVQSLVDKSWLRTRAVADAPRFDFYSAAHEYAAARRRARATGADSAEADAEARHGRDFARMGDDDALEDLHRRRDDAPHAALRVNVENLVTACRRALQRADAATAVRTYLAANEVLRDRERRITVQLGDE